MTKYIKLLTLILLITFCGCNNNADRYRAELSGDTAICKPYFTYDKVEHYYLNISEDEIWKIEEKKKKTDRENKQMEILIQDTPDKLQDTAVIKDLNKIGFVERNLSKKQMEHLDKIFCERKHDDGLFFTCIAIYRDVLVFKKANKIVGTAKICFECGKNIITGTSRNTEYFGQSGDYEELYRILH